LAASAPASDRAQEAARAATGFVAGNFNGQIAPAAPSASEVAGQKTEEKSRQVEADRLSEANQIAQNRSQQNQQNQQNEQQNSQEKAKGGVVGAAVAVEEKPQSKDQSPAAPNPVSALQYDKEAPTKGGERAAVSEQISPRDAQTLPADNNNGVRVL